MRLAMSPREDRRLRDLRERLAWRDFMDRAHRGDADYGFYYPGEPRPHIAWWRRLLKLPPPHLDDSLTRAHRRDEQEYAELTRAR